MKYTNINLMRGFNSNLESMASKISDCVWKETRIIFEFLHRDEKLCTFEIPGKLEIRCFHEFPLPT